MLRHHELYSPIYIPPPPPYVHCSPYPYVHCFAYLRRPSGPLDPTGFGSGGLNPTPTWGLTASRGSGACSGPREREWRDRQNRRSREGEGCTEKWGGDLWCLEPLYRMLKPRRYLKNDGCGSVSEWTYRSLSGACPANELPSNKGGYDFVIIIGFQFLPFVDLSGISGWIVYRTWESEGEQTATLTQSRHKPTPVPKRQKFPPPLPY